MEIWQQVFYVLVVTATSAYERAVIRGTLSSVCRQWRLGVLNCPELWTVLPPIDLRLKAPERSITEEFSIAKHIHDQVQWHLECSGSLPIDFSFHVSILREDNIAMQILQLLIKHSDRWGRVDIDVDADAQVEVLEALQEVEGRLHALEKLRFCLQFNRFQPPSSGFMPLEGKRLEVRCFTKAPRLRHVELCLAPNYKFPGISTLDASVILPFHQLRTFVLCSLKGVSAAYKDLLSFSPNNLTTLIIDMQMDPTIQPQLTLPAVTFPNVVHLACRGSWYMGLPVLEPLTLPSLVTLKVQGGWMSNGFWYQSIINLIKRSKCQLRDVSFRWTEPNSTTLLLEILSLSPTITHLFLYNCDLPVLSALATGSVLPSLQYLKLYISLSIAMSPNPPELRTLVRIIESRSSMRDNLSEGIEPLREVSLRWPDSQGRLPGSLPMLEKALSDIANRGLHKPPPARAQAHVALLSEEVPKLLVAFDTYTKISPSDFDTRIERIRDRGVDSSPPTSAQEVAIDSILKKFELVNLAEPSSSIPFLVSSSFRLCRLGPNLTESSSGVGYRGNCISSVRKRDTHVTMGTFSSTTLANFDTACMCCWRSGGLS